MVPNLPSWWSDNHLLSIYKEINVSPTETGYCIETVHRGHIFKKKMYFTWQKYVCEICFVIFNITFGYCYVIVSQHKLVRLLSFMRETKTLLCTWQTEWPLRDVYNVNNMSAVVLSSLITRNRKFYLWKCSCLSSRSSPTIL